MLTKITGSLWMPMTDHFFNNAIINLLHIVTISGADELQVIRISIAQTVSFLIAIFIYLQLRGSELLKNIMKIILVGMITTICRIIGQFLIPAGEQSILGPSMFAINGTMPLAFSLYGVFAYSLIASMFLLVRNQLTGNRVWQGLKYGIACCAIWVVYLFEPLPHVAPLDRITYPIADSMALLVMGVLLGFLFGETKSHIDKKAKRNDIIPLIVIPACFIFGRLIQYFIFDTYSSFDNKRFETVVWCILTGFVVACVMVWFNRYVEQKSRVAKAFILGGLLFGLDLTLFNFFMPLVFDADIPDLILRTAIDLSTVMLGCLSLNHKQLCEDNI